MLSTRLLLGALLLPIFYFLDQNLHKAYIFDPAKLQQISQNAIAIHGNDTLPMMRQITADLKAEYGSAIVDWTKEDWFFNNAGGAMVSQSKSLHCLLRHPLLVHRRDGAKGLSTHCKVRYSIAGD